VVAAVEVPTGEGVPVRRGMAAPCAPSAGGGVAEAWLSSGAQVGTDGGTTTSHGGLLSGGENGHGEAPAMLLKREGRKEPRGGG
jgi:hypothetical protein